MGGIDLLNIDYSFFYQLVLFLLTVFVLSRFMIRPISKTLEERDERLTPAEEDTGLADNISKKEEEYKSMLSEVRSAASKVRQEVREEAGQKEASIVTEAKEQANKSLKEGQKQIEDSLAVAKEDLDKDVPKLAKELAGKILGRKVEA